ncbi:FAD-dependent oxidoreductase [Amycolatopsis balhimycina DSM 5908]|uniref:FAD-dependent oxidoreductase n=1 Tax=Amycolatopsis balhimycina DSM 5908 TaxID=1081091 RepID=A0A428WJY2_AMYBA|nr:FAD-dependent oxidoreductase [Amycolatopsis balhimycina]RSM43381.1 FAD-dependent oxidoreductase [Amycolatopsis balhimycina DSM 5908]
MDADVIVVGAGPVGLFLAAELALAGADALVLERRETPSEETKARGLGTLATEALRRRGLGDQLAEADAEGTKDLARDHGSTLGHFASIHKIVPDPGRPRTNIWQPELERVLAKHTEGVRVLRGHEVTTLESDVDSVTVTAGGREWRAKYLVGCDGGRSTVRKLAGFAFPGTPALLHTIAGRVRFAGEVPPGGRYATGAFLYGGSMAGVTEPAGPERDEPVTPDELSAAIHRVTGVAVVVEEVRDGRRFGDQARQAATYRLGRVFLAGDAAHVHSPSGGQGLNLGIPDAANLGWKLGAVLRGDKPEAFLDTYTRERHPAGEAVLRNTRAQSALLAPGPHVDALREIVAELLDLPEANRYFANLLSGIGHRYNFPYPAPKPVGEHCPDLELVHADGRESRLFEHTRTGRGLLLATGHPAGPRVDVVPVTNTGPLLLRPDGVIAWAGEGPLDVALDTWF